VASRGVDTDAGRHCEPWDVSGSIELFPQYEENDVSLTISDALLQAAHMSEAELRQEIAVMLFQRDKLTLAQASQFAHMSRLQFQHMLASRQIPVHYDVAEFAEDIHTLQRLGRL
jgi:predicted HTH domain antitoxin